MPILVLFALPAVAMTGWGAFHSMTGLLHPWGYWEFFVLCSPLALLASWKD